MRASQGAKIWSGKCRDAQWRAKTVLPGSWKLVMDRLAAFLNDIGDDGMCQLVMATAQWRLVCLMSGNRLGLALCHYFYYFFCFLHFFAAVCFFGGTTLLCGACFSLSLGGLACRLSARLTGSWRGKIFFEPFSSIATVIHIRETRDTLFSIDICCVRRVRLAVRLVAVRPRDETKPNKHRFCGDNNVVSRVIASR